MAGTGFWWNFKWSQLSEGAVSSVNGERPEKIGAKIRNEDYLSLANMIADSSLSTYYMNRLDPRAPHEGVTCLVVGLVLEA
jgi:hypothetical protein